jgi:hypothetical protein
MATHLRFRRTVCLAITLCIPPGMFAPARADEEPSTRPAGVEVSPWVHLSDQDRRNLDRCVARGLDRLASQQRADGSFPTLESGQPGVTSICVLAFLSAGHVPGEDRFGRVIDKAIDYALRCQHPDGLLCLRYPSGVMQGYDPPHTAMYNHAITGLMLSEAYGMAPRPDSQQMRKAIELALGYTRNRQRAPKRYPDDKGGWRYLQPLQDSDSDLSVTSWQLIFIRSCRNAGFDVPSEQVDAALAYVHRCYNPDDGSFWYALRGVEHVTRRGMVGAGILSLSLGGQHHTPEAMKAGKWVLAHPFNRYRGAADSHDRFFYGAFYCSQAMFQLGGTYWSQFYPTLLQTLVGNQHADGAWDSETGADAMFGNSYTTAMAILALTPPYQLLPIFQR